MFYLFLGSMFVGIFGLAILVFVSHIAIFNAFSKKQWFWLVGLIIFSYVLPPIYWYQNKIEFKYPWLLVKRSLILISFSLFVYGISVFFKLPMENSSILGHFENSLPN